MDDRHARARHPTLATVSSEVWPEVRTLSDPAPPKVETDFCRVPASDPEQAVARIVELAAADGPSWMSGFGILGHRLGNSRNGPSLCDANGGVAPVSPGTLHLSLHVRSLQ